MNLLRAIIRRGNHPQCFLYKFLCIFCSSEDSKYYSGGSGISLHLCDECFLDAHLMIKPSYVPDKFSVYIQPLNLCLLSSANLFESNQFIINFVDNGVVDGKKYF